MACGLVVALAAYAAYRASGSRYAVALAPWPWGLAQIIWGLFPIVSAMGSVIFAVRRDWLGAAVFGVTTLVAIPIAYQLARTLADLANRVF